MRVKDKFPNSEIVGIDIVDRGYPDTIVHDFLTYETNKKFNNIITNPPFFLAKEFVEKGMKLLSDNGKMAMFLKIQFLESEKRRDLFKKYPPKYIYVFSKRIKVFVRCNCFICRYRRSYWSDRFSLSNFSIPTFFFYYESKIKKIINF